MPQQIIDLCKQASELNYSAQGRKGSVMHLPDKGKVIVSGDLHGHPKNFARIVAHADLANNPDTYVVLQEILHGGPEDEHGGCLSFRIFFEALRYKIQYPDQVHLVLGNHDTAIITDSNVLKGGKEMTQAMKRAMKRCFDEEFEDVEQALKDYLLSQPIAIKTANRIWISHSLPDNKYVEDFDMTVFDRNIQIEDIPKPGPLYTLTWGRRHSQEALDKLAEILDVDTFILGHQAQDSGYAKAGENLIIIDSGHNHGHIISFDLSRPYTADKLMDYIIPLASIIAA